MDAQRGGLALGRRGARSPCEPGTVTRDRPRPGARVRARGRALRRGGALRERGAAGRARRGSSAAQGALTVEVPPSEPAALEATIAALGGRGRAAARTRAAARSSSATCSPRCCCGWSAGTTPRTPSARPDDADSSSTGASSALLERDFARHHDAAWYADALAVPAAAALARARRRHRPHDQAADHRPGDARSGPAAAVHRSDGGGDRVPHRIRGPALLLPRVQTPLR